jgi:hypothetical protein
MEKKIAWMTLAAICVLSSVVFALDPMGSTVPELKQGEKSIGAEYAYSTEDLDLDNASWSSNSNPVLELDDIHKIYAKLAWGITDDFEGFIRVGGVGVDHTFGVPSGDWEGGTDWDFAWGAGFKTTLFESSETLKWGLLAQYSWLNVDGDRDFEGVNDGESYKLEQTGIQIAFGPTWQVADTMKLFGGVFWYEADGHYKVYEDYSNSHPIEADKQIGGYIGGQFDLGCTKLNVEYSATGDADLIGINLMWLY